MSQITLWWTFIQQENEAFHQFAELRPSFTAFKMASFLKSLHCNLQASVFSEKQDRLS